MGEIVRISGRRTRWPLVAAVVLSFVFFGPGQCTKRLGKGEIEMAKLRAEEARQALAMNYRDSHDYYSLTRLLPYLEIRRRTRADVERLLGQPAYSPLPHLSYYPTNRTVAVACPEGSMPEEESCLTKDSRQVKPLHAFPVILVVAYVESEGQPHPEDRLDAISLGPVGE